MYRLRPVTAAVVLGVALIALASLAGAQSCINLSSCAVTLGSATPKALLANSVYLKYATVGSNKVLKTVKLKKNVIGGYGGGVDICGSTDMFIELYNGLTEIWQVQLSHGCPGDTSGWNTSCTPHQQGLECNYKIHLPATVGPNVNLRARTLAGPGPSPSLITNLTSTAFVGSIGNGPFVLSNGLTMAVEVPGATTPCICETPDQPCTMTGGSSPVVKCKD